MQEIFIVLTRMEGALFRRATMAHRSPIDRQLKMLINDKNQ